MAIGTYYQNQTLKAARESEVTAADFDNGVNMGGSCAPGIGINIAGGDVTGTWSLLDQHEAVRVPQDSQHIGEGASVGSVPITCADYENSDFNDTANLAVLATGWVMTEVA